MNIYSVYSAIFKHWRAKRFRLFLEIIRPTKMDRILDVGGYPGTWTNSAPCAKSITCLNIHPIDWDTARSPQHNVTVALGDARNMSEISSKEYDVVFSNSVVEHVGTWSDQQAFAHEVRRVGKTLWIQTPAKECPIEPHYLAPFIHWLPKSTQKRLVRWLSVYGLLQRPSQSQADDFVDSIRLLSKGEVAILFPDCNILEEKLFFVFPKSYIAIRRD